jgi:hypothetical protein
MSNEMKTVTVECTTNFKEAAVVLVEIVYIQQEDFSEKKTQVLPRNLCSLLLQEPDE